MTKATLIADNIEFAYQVDKPLIEKWSAVFVPGEIVAITGPSGRGKSSLLYILGLMLEPNKGEVYVSGAAAAHAADSYRANLRARHFGFVFQDAALDATRSVLDNVLEGALYRGERRSDYTSIALDLLDALEVRVRANSKPNQVSGGQAQRIALCRALLHSPSIILADEPTGNLDTDSAELVMRAFGGAADRGAVVIIVTHDSRVTERCHRQIAL